MRQPLVVLGIATLTTLAVACAPQTPTGPAHPSTPYFDEDSTQDGGGGGGLPEDTVCRGGFLGSGTRC
jgi:hypothetical protein